MSRRGFIPALLLILAPLFGTGCHGDTVGLLHSEVEFLSEDVIDLMTVVFQAGENSFVGDPVDPADVIDAAGPGNDFTVTYDLVQAMRVGLGEGSGRARLKVTEDGTPSADPLAFSFGTTAALVVELDYELRYQGVGVSGRPSDVDLVVFVTATRASPSDPFLVEYFVDGTCDFGPTLCDVTTRFRAPGRPRDGVEPLFGDGEGVVDDPDVLDFFDYDLDFSGVDSFRVEGEVGPCCFFEEDFFYSEVF